MTRREFLTTTGQIATAGLISGSLLGCNPTDSLFEDEYILLKNGKSWKNYQLAVNIGSQGTYDTTGCSHPTVIKEGSLYKMWYAGSNGNLRIIYCESTNSINWSNFQLAVNIASQGTYDTTNCFGPTVIKEGSLYKMWYAGNNGTNIRIIYCESTNGINWSNFQLAVNIASQGTYDTIQSSFPTIIKEGSLYKMWYAGSDGTNARIIYCESTNGINWSNFQLAVNIASQGTYDTGDAGGPAVIKDGSLYKMWYGGNNGTNDRIIYCESANGVNWGNYQLVIDINASGTGYDTTKSWNPCVINENGVGKMWYTGSNGTNRILYAESY